MNKAVVIDFDETLVDLHVDWQLLREKISQVFSEYGVEVNLHPLTQGIADGLKQVGDREEVKAKINDVYDRIEENSLLYSTQVPGSGELLTALKEKGYLLIIYSANNQQVVINGLLKYNLIVNRVIGRVPKKLIKSDPEAHKAFKDEITDLDVCAVIGDSKTDEAVAQYLNVNFYKVEKTTLQQKYVNIINEL